jgi:hypothetical protein
MLGGAADSPAETARAEKYLKGRLAAAADHFNRDQKKGFQYLQTLRLLPTQLDPASIARFLRCCPGLAKGGIGEILGERDDFYEQVREAFMQTFDFTGERGAGGQRSAPVRLGSKQRWLAAALLCLQRRALKHGARQRGCCTFTRMALPGC